MYPAGYLSATCLSVVNNLRHRFFTLIVYKLGTCQKENTWDKTEHITWPGKQFSKEHAMKYF